jgi:predicted transcriptional regulator
MSDRWFSQEQRQARLAALDEAVMIGAAEADRGELLDGESVMQALRDKLESWKVNGIDGTTT